MQPQIKKSKEIQLIGMHLQMSLSENRTPELWRKFMGKKSEIKNVESTETISMSVYPQGYFNAFNPNMKFDKWAAIPVSSVAFVPDEMKAVIIPSGMYAVFNYKGLSTDPSIFRYIFNTWLPESDYQLDNRPHFEILGDKYKNNDAESEEEIWIPVVKK
ncbi:MAG: GyrI-like domain-containing protein [Bacteroidetes bacterium]|nr:GyrI-like domain-containing protein [Bacteroidota bacterium]